VLFQWTSKVIGLVGLGILSACAGKCPITKAPADDEIRLSNKTGTGSAAIVLDGRRTACFHDEVRHALSTVTLPNIMASSSCSSLLMVLAVDNAVKKLPSPPWSDNSDVVEVEMSALAKMPLSVWIAAGIPSDAQVDVSVAKMVFNGMQCGVDFDPVIVSDRRTAAGVSGLGKRSCGDVATLKSTVGFSAGQLNVYYLEGISTPLDARGVACQTDRDIVLIAASTALSETLAHEVGHAFTLEHTNGLAVPGNNLMLSGGLERETLTTGQCIRSNVNPLSAMVTLGPASPLGTGCQPVAGDAICPAVQFDVNPK
jgi:hypothetical protein